MGLSSFNKNKIRADRILAHRLASIIFIAFIILSIIYSIATPPFEAGDESRHYSVVKYMADSGRLIVQNVPETAELQHHWSHEGNQPPLYYALAAGLTFWIDDGEWDDVFWYNPHTSIGDPLRPDNKNITIHPPDTLWPWRNHILAAYLIRLLSIVMASITIIAAYHIALSLFRGNRLLAAGAMAITAFNPMFIFISASINNDNAVIMFITLALWVMVRALDEPLSDKSTFRLPIVLGILIGLGALSKLYAFGVLPLAGLLFIWLAYKAAPTYPKMTMLLTPALWRTVILQSVILAVVFTIVAGWFYIRNAILYDGDFFALQVMRHTAGQREEIPTLATIQAEFEGFRIAYWALFGGVNILADTWIYPILDWVSLVAAIGVLAFVIQLIRTKFSSQFYSIPSFFLLMTWYLVMIAGFIVWNLTQPAGQGRLMYPAIAAISAFGILGLTWWTPTSVKPLIVGMCAAGLFLFSLIAPFRYIAPAYASPPLLSQADLPPSLQPVDFIYDGKIRLVGYQIHADTIRPAEKLPITLYWEVITPTEINYSLFIHLLGRQRQVIGQLDTYPGGGKWPTTLLKSGDVLADRYVIPIKPEAEFDHAPSQIQIAAGIYDLNEPGLPGKPTTNAAGELVEPIIGTAKLVPWEWPKPPATASINFFDKVTLLSHEINDNQNTVTFNWQVNQPFETDYTIFIQAWHTETNAYVYGFDGPPVENAYPTSLWEPGETIVDAHPLDLSQLPPGEYYLLAGLYNPGTGERLPAFGPEGPLPDYAVNVGTLQIPQ